MSTPLCDLARKYACDKGGDHFLAGQVCHNYTPVYHALLENRREEMRVVLEIGVNKGSSLRMWEEYFPNAAIIGIDIDPACLFNEGRIRCFEADQSSGPSLARALAHAGPYQYGLIVDDGSHQISHQMTTMKSLLPYLSKDGLYVIEDMADDSIWRLMDAVPGRYIAEQVACFGSKGPNPYSEHLLVIKHP